MKRSMIAVVSSVVALLLAATASASITIPDGTLTIPLASPAGWRYAYSISSTSIDAQTAPWTNVTGTVTGYSLPKVNAGWFEIGLIQKSTRDIALASGPGPGANEAWMFNQSVFMMGMKSADPSTYVVMPSDRDGTKPGGVGQAQSIGSSFTFDLKLVPTGMAGGTAYLSVDGGAYGTGLTYGTDNWTGYPPENLSDAYLIAQLFMWADPGQTYSVSFENVTATPIPKPASILVWCLLGAGSWLGMRVWRQRRVPVGRQPWSPENRQAIHDLIAR